MEIIKKVNRQFLFRVLKSFTWGGRSVEVGEELTIMEPDATALTQRGKVIPCDLPEAGEYVALVPLSVEGRVEKFTCLRLEKVSIQSHPALDLMLRRLIVPANDDQWRPHGLKLKTTGRATPRR